MNTLSEDLVCFLPYFLCCFFFVFVPWFNQKQYEHNNFSIARLSCVFLVTLFNTLSFPPFRFYKSAFVSCDLIKNWYDHSEWGFRLFSNAISLRLSLSLCYDSITVFVCCDFITIWAQQIFNCFEVSLLLYCFSSWFFRFFSCVFKYVFMCCEIIMSPLSEDFVGFLI